MTCKQLVVSVEQKSLIMILIILYVYLIQMIKKYTYGFFLFNLNVTIIVNTLASLLLYICNK